MSQIQTNDRVISTLNSSRNFLIKNNLNINRQTTSIIGTSNYGPSFTPTSYKIFYDNNDINDYMNSFSVNHDSLLNNHKEKQGNILPYITAYSILQQAKSQLNFTRLTGLDLKDASLKPGFLLNNNFKLYLMTISIQKKQSAAGFFNYNNLNEENYYQCIFLSKNCELEVNNFEIQNNFLLKLKNVTGDLTTKLKNTIILNPDQSIQNKIFTYTNNDKPNNLIRFNFNMNDDFYITNNLNTNIQRLDDFGYVMINYHDVLKRLEYDIADVRINAVTLTELSDNRFKDFQEPHKYATTPWIVSQGFYEQNQILNRSQDGLKLKDRVIKLFKIHALNTGKYMNEFAIKIIPNSLSINDWSTFHLHLIDKKTEDKIYEFNNLNLNPDSQDFIGRVIGTARKYYDHDIKRIVEEGNYAIQNPWIRVELSDHVMNKVIPITSIPAGFLGGNKIKSDLINENYLVLNDKYTLMPQLRIKSNEFGKSLLNKKHAWGKNFKNISTDVHFLKNSLIFKLNKETAQKISKKEQEIKVINYTNFFNKLIKDRLFENNNYLNSFFYDKLNEENYDDMFHLEKILLINQYNPDLLTFKQNWYFARYIQTGEDIDILKNDENFYKYFFENNDELNKLFYYFTINEKGGTNLGIDSISEAKNFDLNTNILSFNVEMFGGWDGLNLLDIDEYSINNAGLEKSAYLRELYKVALDIIFDEVNGQNELIYLPEISEQNVLDYAYSLIQNNSYSLLLLDNPFYDINNNKIYTKDISKLDSGINTTQFKWNDQKYIYKSNNEIDNLQFNFSNTVIQWIQSECNLSNVLTFGNYMDLTLINTSNINFDKFDNTFIAPAGLAAITILAAADSLTGLKMNPLYNNEVISFGDFILVNSVEDSIDIDNPILKVNIRNINNLNVNLLFVDVVNGAKMIRFYSDKNSQFSINKDSILSKINARNTLNDIKRKIKLSSLSNLFTNVRSIKDVTNQYKVAYNLILTKYLNNNLITNYNITLDESTTSREDILEGIVRGSITLAFPNQQVVKITT